MARKRLKMVKKALCLIFAFLLSIDTFAAVVGDYDGAAFVTKAEFESLKKDFNEQMFRYNRSLDDKIDGKIAAYLSGIKIEKRQDLTSLLDKNGKYGNKYDLYWNSRSDWRWMNDDHREAVQTINCQIVGYDPAGPDNQFFWGGNYSWNDLYGDVENTVLDPQQVANLVYIYDDDGTFKENQIYYEKVKNYITWQYYFQFYQNRGTTYDGQIMRNPGSISYSHDNIINDNLADLTQINMKNHPMTYLRGYMSRLSFWDVWKQCYVTITQEEKDETDLLICPNSTVAELVWDKTNNDVSLGKDGYINTAYKYPSSTGPYYVSGRQIVNNSTSLQLALGTFNRFWFPWQVIEDRVSLKSRKIKNLIDINNMNSAAENGVVVGTMPDQKGEITACIKVRVSAPGYVYMYVGDKAIKNWKETSFQGKKVQITDTSESKLIEYKDVSKNQTVWVFYEIDPATDISYKLYIDEFYYIAA